MFKLVICDDEGRMTVVPLVRDEITIGRKEGNTIRLTERNVSRKHAKLRKVNGALLVEDLSSYNGVRVNGKRIEAETSVKGGDQIGIGDYILALHVDDANGAGGPGPGGGAMLGSGPLFDSGALGSSASTGAATAILTAPTSAPGPPARLVMLSPPAPGAEFALSRPRLRIGRAEDLDVWVNHRSISREHAEISKEGTEFHIRDLGSANGIRVNGREVTEATIGPGSVVELGQVRFRLVGAGELYTFEGDRTIQMEAFPSGPSKAPLFVAVAIVAAAVVVAALVAILSGQEPVAHEIAADDSEVGSDSELAAASFDELTGEGRDRIAKALEDCEAALQDKRYGEAIAFADQALAVDSDHLGAQDCRKQASAFRSDEEKFARGRDLLSAEDYRGAYFELQELSSQSELRNRDEFRRAKEGYIKAEMDAARAALRAEDFSRVAESVRRVQEVPDLPSNLADDARGLLEEAEKRQRLAALKRDTTTRPRVKTNSPAEEPPQPRRPAAQPETADAKSAFEEAKACAVAGNHQCVVRKLNGRTNNAQELGLLIETHRHMGNVPAWIRSMKEYVQRFPSSSSAANYRQMLARHGH